MDELDVLDRAFMGRSKFLAFAGATLTAFATRLWFSDAAAAYHTGPQYPCYGFPACHSCCCYGADCPGCTRYYNGGCPSGSYCWNQCWGGDLYACCDYIQYGSPCVCRSFQGQCA